MRYVSGTRTWNPHEVGWTYKLVSSRWARSHQMCQVAPERYPSLLHRQPSFSRGRRLWLSALRVVVAPRLIGTRCSSQLANHESHNRHVLVFLKQPTSKPDRPESFGPSVRRHPNDCCCSSCSAGSEKRFRTNTHLEDQLYPIVKCELHASAVDRVRHLPQACGGRDR